MIFGSVFEASPHVTEGSGHVILGQHHQHSWAFVSHFWPHLEFWRGLEASYVWCQEGNWGLNRPHDAHDAGSWGAAGRLKCAMQSNKTLKIHAVGRVCGCKYHLNIPRILEGS